MSEWLKALIDSAASRCASSVTVSDSEWPRSLTDGRRRRLITMKPSLMTASLQSLSLCEIVF